MINLDSITLKDINQKLESVDPKIREVMESELFTDRISEISSFYNFDLTDREDLAFHKLVAITILGFIQPADLPEAILTLIDTDEETANEAANEVKKVIAPLTPEVKNPPQNAPTSKPPTPEIPKEISLRPNASEAVKTKPLEPKPEVEPTKPTQQPTQTQQKTEQSRQQPHLTKAVIHKPADEPKSAKPFVIHEDVEVKPTTEQNVEEENPTRPMFYKPSFSQESGPKSVPTKVKVDLGNEESLNPQAAPKRKDYTIHTPKTENKEDTTGPISNSEVHPENIVDLKDLPR